MKGFLKTFIIGLAALFLIAAGAIVTVGLAAGKDLKKVLREYVLSADEKEAIKNAGKKTQEPALIQAQKTQSTDEILEALAERVGSNKVNELAEAFKAKLNGLRERDTYLEQRYTEMQIAEGDLDRKARQLRRERIEMQQQRGEFEKERAEFARKQIEIVKQVQVISDVERKQMMNQVKTFEHMKDAAWESFRTMDPALIARYLALMDAKKAARILTLANNDEDYPTIGMDIIRYWKTIDMDGISGDQINRLAGLYVYIKAPEVAEILIRENDVDQAAMILSAMQVIGGPKKVAPVKVALMEKDPRFAASIEAQLAKFDNTEPVK